MAEINRFLTDPRDLVLLVIEDFEKFGHGIKSDFLISRSEIGEDTQGNGCVACGSAAAAAVFFLIINGRLKLPFGRVPHKAAEFSP